MTFQKGNTLWKEGLKTRVENQDRMARFLGIIVSGGLDEYANKLDQLASKKDLTKAEQEFMDRFEGWREFVLPKLSRKEVTGKDGKDLFPKPILGGLTKEQD